MTIDEKVYFVYGYAYCLAEQMKKDGSFNDLKTDELARWLLSDACKEVKK